MEGAPGRERLGGSLRLAAATTARSSAQVAQFLWPVARCSAAVALKVLWAGIRFLLWMTRELVKLLLEYLVQSAQPPSQLQPPPPVQAVARAPDLPVGTEAEAEAEAEAETANETFFQHNEKGVEARETEEDNSEASEALCQGNEESAMLPETQDSSTERPTQDATERPSSGNASCGLFTLRFKVRDAWDQPEDDELLDASLVNEWIDLGNCKDASSGCAAATPTPTARNEDAKEEHEEKEGGGDESSMGNEGELVQGHSATPADRGQGMPSPRSVLQARLQQVLPTDADVHAQVDTDDTSSDGQARGGIVIRFAGPLRSQAWETACRSVLGCEACGVYLAGSYDAIFSNLAPDLVQPLEDLVACALGHWSGDRAKCIAGAGMGLEGAAFSGFESLSTNVAAVLRGEAPPGWHRLEWTPHGTDAVSHMTY